MFLKRDLIFWLLLASLLISSCSSRYLKSPHSYDNTLANLFEALEQQNPCATKQCDFPSKCITMPNTECSDCPGIAMCVHYG